MRRVWLAATLITMAGCATAPQLVIRRYEQPVAVTEAQVGQPIPAPPATTGPPAPPPAYGQVYPVPSSPTQIGGGFFLTNPSPWRLWLGINDQPPIVLEPGALPFPLAPGYYRIRTWVDTASWRGTRPRLSAPSRTYEFQVGATGTPTILHLRE